MDPHSRRSQFNQRFPKSGPQARAVEIMRDPQKHPLKHTQGASAPSSLLIRRPIATNSRVKQDQNVRRDMYLAFVNNALHEKSIVRPPIHRVPHILTSISAGKQRILRSTRQPIQLQVIQQRSSNATSSVESLDCCSLSHRFTS
jgi:hypothetical protein